MRRAIDAVADVVAPGTVFTHVTDDEVRAGLAATVPGWPAAATGLLLGAAPTPLDPADLVRFGADVQRLRAALAAEGVGSDLLPPPPGSAAERHARAVAPASACARSRPANGRVRRPGRPGPAASACAGRCCARAG